ncbi:hypothetical protein CPB86DRAFT_562022 [Serendipita vermifera]|nr:hypothetical protein CPB86DRAFT_562022 [Serendipita vermifera]
MTFAGNIDPVFPHTIGEHDASTATRPWSEHSRWRMARCQASLYSNNVHTQLRNQSQTLYLLFSLPPLSPLISSGLPFYWVDPRSRDKILLRA